MATNKLIRLIRDVNHLIFCNVLKDPFLKLKNNLRYLRNLPYSNGLLRVDIENTTSRNYVGHLWVIGDTTAHTLVS